MRLLRQAFTEKGDFCKIILNIRQIMNSDDSSPRAKIINLLNVKSVIKSQIFDQCLEVFGVLKDVLSEMSNDLNDMLQPAYRCV